MEKLEERLKAIEKKANLNSNPYDWLYRVSSTKVWPTRFVREELFIYNERESIGEDREIQIQNGGGMIHVAQGVNFLPFEKRVAHLQKCKDMGEDMFMALYHAYEPEMLIALFKMGVRLPTGYWSHYAQDETHDIGADEDTEAVLERTELLFQHTEFEPNGDDLKRMICNSHGFRLDILPIMSKYHVNMDTDPKASILSLIWRTEDQNRLLARPNRDGALELMHTALKGGANPDRIISAALFLEDKRPYLIILLQYSTIDVKTLNLESPYLEQIIKLREENPCIHWCSLQLPWSIQRLFWIAHLKGEGPLSLLPVELLREIFDFCSISHITYAQRAQLLRERRHHF